MPVTNMPSAAVGLTTIHLTRAEELLRGKAPWTLGHHAPDHATLKPAAEAPATKVESRKADRTRYGERRNDPVHEGNPREPAG